MRVQAVQEADWGMLVSLWAAYRRYLAHVFALITASKPQTLCRIGEGEPGTLESIAQGYVSHLVHHLNQIMSKD